MFLQLTTFSICHLKRIDGLDSWRKKKVQAATRNQQKQNFPMKYPSDRDVAGLGKDSVLLASFWIQRLQMRAFKAPLGRMQNDPPAQGPCQTWNLPAAVAGKGLFPDSKPETGTPRVPLAPVQ